MGNPESQSFPSKKFSWPPRGPSRTHQAKTTKLPGMGESRQQSPSEPPQPVKKEVEQATPKSMDPEVFIGSMRRGIICNPEMMSKRGRKRNQGLRSPFQDRNQQDPRATPQSASRYGSGQSVNHPSPGLNNCGTVDSSHQHSPDSAFHSTASGLDRAEQNIGGTTIKEETATAGGVNDCDEMKEKKVKEGAAPYQVRQLRESLANRKPTTPKQPNPPPKEKSPCNVGKAAEMSSDKRPPLVGCCDEEIEESMTSNAEKHDIKQEAGQVESGHIGTGDLMNDDDCVYSDYESRSASPSPPPLDSGLSSQFDKKKPPRKSAPALLGNISASTPPGPNKAHVKVGNLFTNKQSSDTFEPISKARKPANGKEEAIVTEIHALLTRYHSNYIDSHCHLDYIFDKTRVQQYGRYLSQWMQSCQHAFPRNFAGCIPNFIDPNLYHDMGNHKTDLQWIKAQVSEHYVLGATYGIHPKHSSIYNEGMGKTLDELLMKSEFKAIAVGECGLDTNRNTIDIHKQIETFEVQLDLAHKHGLPVVIHCRGTDSGDGYETERICIDVLKRKLSKFHTIHRHCFRMDLHTLKLWTEAFPNVYFGLTPFRGTATSNQLEAIRHMQLARILLETDSPYFRPRKFNEAVCITDCGQEKVSLPGMAICTAEDIADAKNLTVEEVLRATYENTKRCYHRLTDYD